MRIFTLTFSCFILLILTGSAQSNPENPYVKLGQKALIDGNFKAAVTHLEKSLPAENNNANVMYMLGYSYYHSGDYQKAISSFSRVVSLKPGEVSAYYYRGKARNLLGTQMESKLSAFEKEKLLQAAIRDFTKAIELNNEDLKLYQNRAIAYRDYGILKSQKIPKFYNKGIAADAFESSINDFRHVLDANPSRKDIATEIKKAKVYMANLDN